MTYQESESTYQANGSSEQTKYKVQSGLHKFKVKYQ